MTIRLEQCTNIEASPAAVWETIEPLDRHVDWMADAAEITFVGEQRTGVGTVLECLTRLGPLHTRDRMEVTEWQPGASMSIAHRGAVTGTGRFRLRAHGTGTRICWDEELRFPWWMGGPAGERAAAPVLRRIWAGNLDRLAALVERAGPQAAPDTSTGETAAGSRDRSAE